MLFLSLIFVLIPPALSAGTLGDFDCDGDFDVDDLDLLVAEIATGGNDILFDVNEDGLVDLLDRLAWLTLAGSINNPSGFPYIVGDANLDGRVDGFDFIAWNANKFTSSTAWSRGDFFPDGVIDGQDFLQWASNRFTSSFRGSSASYRVIFDEVSGALWLDTQSSDAVVILIDGVQAQSIDTLADMSDLDGQFFIQAYFAGFEQWIRTNPLFGSGIEGLFQFATYPPGTTLGDFGEWTIAAGDGSVATGQVEDFCETGNVNFGVGSIADVLTVNGQTGQITVSTSQPLYLSLAASPAGPAAPRYCLWVWVGLQTNKVELSFGASSLGCIVNPTPIHGGLEPQPFLCLRGGLPNLVCRSTREMFDFAGDGNPKQAPSVAPFTLSRPNGLDRPLTFDFQGILEDLGGTNATGFSVTNRVTLTSVAP